MNAQAALEKKPKDLRFFPADPEHAKHLTREQVEHFNALGYLPDFEAFPRPEAEANRRFIDRVLDQAQELGWDRYSIINFELYCATLYDMVRCPAVLDVVEDLIGPNFICFGAHLFAKGGQDQKQVTWHQDAPYYQLTPSKSVTAWLAIDDVDSENSAMQVIPRSHLKGEIEMVESDASENNVLTRTTLDPESHGDPATTLALPMGHFSIHSDLLLHGSGPNRSGRRRCGLAMRYAPVDVRALTQWNKLAVPCRGEDPEGHWRMNPRPEGDRLPVKPESGDFFDIENSVPLDGDQSEA